MERVDCLTLASPKSAILAVPRAVIRILDDLQSRWMMEGFRVCRYSRPRAISSIMLSYEANEIINQAQNGERLTTLCKEGVLMFRI